MALKNINPTQTEAWKHLSEHYNEIKGTHLRTFFNENPTRKDDFTVNFNDFSIDLSKNRIDETTLKHLVSLAEQTELKDAIAQYFGGEKINKTESAFFCIIPLF